MQTILFQAHSGWRYIVLALLIIAIIKYVIGWLTKGNWSNLDQILGTATPISIDIQVLLGLVLWISAPAAWFHGRGTVNVWEHMVTMLLALGAAHAFWSRVKKSNTDADKFRNGAIGFIVAGLLVAIGVARITGYMG
ncbi:MAG: hypothetical protein KDE50_19385 [Caldilineaceae bacterium]|nr:hypothetical protein [Caldilineaceae bacterium]MCB0142076.1 hypothetical protein [Caldilineaceae bacterium]MCB9157251.1 hypothetical protein [Caldilineaceae bacterium]